MSVPKQGRKKGRVRVVSQTGVCACMTHVTRILVVVNDLLVVATLLNARSRGR